MAKRSSGRQVLTYVGVSAQADCDLSAAAPEERDVMGSGGATAIVWVSKRWQAGEDSLDATAPQTCQRTGRAIANQSLGTGDARSRTASAGFGDIVYGSADAGKAD